jgi:hypothetical protein
MNSESPIKDFKSHSKQRKSRKERQISFSNQETGFTIQQEKKFTSIMDIPAQIME